MRTIEELLSERKLPDIFTFSDGRRVTADNFAERRQEMLRILTEEEYGTVPPAPDKVDVREMRFEKSVYAGKAYEREIELSFAGDKGRFAFPAVEVVPKAPGKHPIFVVLNFRPQIPDKYIPMEEILDAGCGIVRICYTDVAADGADDAGSIKLAYDGKYTWGRLSMWAFAASRVMDYLQTTDYADLSRVAVVGHSRLGKTALLCAARDERFFLACANDSGCSGGAITRRKRGESVADITKVFPFWFSPNYGKYAGKENEMPFDQHFLVACIAPRKVAIGTAVEDVWSDPDSHYLTACAAGKVWEALGQAGFVHPDRLANVGEAFYEGNVGYHLRSGPHFFSREDWKHYFKCINS